MVPEPPSNSIWGCAVPAQGLYSQHSCANVTRFLLLVLGKQVERKHCIQSPVKQRVNPSLPHCVTSFLMLPDFKTRLNRISDPEYQFAFLSSLSQILLQHPEMQSLFNHRWTQIIFPLCSQFPPFLSGITTVTIFPFALPTSVVSYLIELFAWLQVSVRGCRNPNLPKISSQAYDL